MPFPRENSNRSDRETSVLFYRHRLLISFWTILQKPSCLLLRLGIQESDSLLSWGGGWGTVGMVVVLELC